MQFPTNFIQQIRGIIKEAQGNAVRAVNNERVIMYWKIGEKIVVEEQNKKSRAEYDTPVKSLCTVLDGLCKNFDIRGVVFRAAIW